MSSDVNELHENQKGQSNLIKALSYSNYPAPLAGKAKSFIPGPKKNWGFDAGNPPLSSVSLTQRRTSSASIPH